MITFRAQDMQKRASELQEAALSEPVVITYHDRPRLVVMSVREYDRLNGRTGSTMTPSPGAAPSQIEDPDRNGGARMRPSLALKANLDRVREIIGQFDVSSPRVFGSVARGDDDEASDIDLLVDPGDEITYYDLARLQTQLEGVLGCRVDVSTPKGLSPDVAKNVASDIRALA